MSARPFPMQCIVPPHMLREIARRGDPSQRAWAAETLARSAEMRQRRSSAGRAALLAPPRPEDAQREKTRAVYDARRAHELPGRLVRSEGQAATNDPAADEAYDGAGATYDFYREAFGRRSIDGRGMRLDASVHYGSGYDNAFWNGTQMVYGDGDGKLFRRFTAALDVIGHELSHGVIQHEAALRYAGQSGALNESLADVFGSLVKQMARAQTAEEADWLIGHGLFAPAVKGEALRSLKAPGSAYDDPVLGRDPQPAHMRDYARLPADDDNGGVHINSGIPNHAFYRIAVALGGHAWEKAGRIWYVALCDRLRSDAGFQRAASLTTAVARALFGEGSAEERAVRSGWEAVGIETAAKVEDPLHPLRV